MTPQLDWDIILKIGALLAGLAVGWGVLQTQGRQHAKRLDTWDTKWDHVITPTLGAFKDNLQANTHLATEALRQAQAAHLRIDAHGTSIQVMEVQQARLEERQTLAGLRRTGRNLALGGDE